ncbi:MAG TPA: GNAT family N-acetyltransferase [Burkholderiaceae bacterium]
MLIRKFKPGEEPELWHLFHDSVHHISTDLYTSEQLRAWSPHRIDAEKWRARIHGIAPFVVEHEKKLIAYADVQGSGYVDHFFVHHQWQRRGVGNLLMQIIVEVAKQDEVARLFSDVSLAARPFFEHWGFTVEREQRVRIGQEVLKNFRMTRELPH